MEQGNSDSSEFTRCDRFFGKDPGYRVYRVYTDAKIPNNNKINHIMVSFTDNFNAISIERLSSKIKIVKDSRKRFMKIILLCKPEFSSATKTSFFIENTKNNHSSTSDWWEYTKYCFKENAKLLSKNSTPQDLVLKRMILTFSNSSTTQENITISRKNLLFFLKNTKKQPLQQVSDGETANLVLKRMLELFLKVHHS